MIGFVGYFLLGLFYSYKLSHVKRFRPCPSPKQGTRLLSLQLEAEGFTARFEKNSREALLHKAFMCYITKSTISLREYQACTKRKNQLKCR